VGISHNTANTIIVIFFLFCVICNICHKFLRKCVNLNLLRITVNVTGNNLLDFLILLMLLIICCVNHLKNKMPSETEVFGFGAATWRAGWNTSRLWFWPIRFVIQQRKRIRYGVAVSWATATDNMFIKFGEILTCGFWDMRGNRQTDRQTYIHADRSTSHPYRYEVTM